MNIDIHLDRNASIFLLCALDREGDEDAVLVVDPYGDNCGEQFFEKHARIALWVGRGSPVFRFSPHSRSGPHWQQVSGSACRSSDAHSQKQSVRGIMICAQFLNLHLAAALQDARHRGRVECPTAASHVQIVKYARKYSPSYILRSPRTTAGCSTQTPECDVYAECMSMRHTMGLHTSDAVAVIAFRSTNKGAARRPSAAGSFL